MHIRLSPRKKRRAYSRQTRAIVLAIALSILLLAQLALLIRLPYTTSLLEHLSTEELIASDAKLPENGFSIGNLYWDIRGYTIDPRLQPLRVYFKDHCAGRTGVAAAFCLSDRFAEQFPFGEPAGDLFAADYDPVAELQDHTEKGRPGNCVTRSGLAAAALLSVGIPARVVQLLPPDGQGHNIFSVWDEKYGWVAIDPTFGEMVADEDGPLSALHAFRFPNDVRRYSFGQESVGAR